MNVNKCETLYSIRNYKQLNLKIIFKPLTLEVLLPILLINILGFNKGKNSSSERE